MSAPFLTTKVANMRIAVEVAWGADLTDLTGASWTWTDITDDVILGGGKGDKGVGGGISITLGRPDFSSETQTAEMTCTLDNRSGAYSEGGMSPHWPYVRRNTPVRVRVSNNGGTNWYIRFQGAANGFTPTWDEQTGRWATVTLSASGPLRRLNQGTLPAKSAMYMGTMADPTVVVYWPMEEEQQSQYLTAAKGDASGEFRTVVREDDEFVTVPGAPGDFASYANVPSSAPFLTMAEGGAAVMSVVTPTTGTSSTTSIILGNPLGTPVGVTGSPYRPSGTLFSVFTPNGASIKRWDVSYFGEYDFGAGQYTGNAGNTFGIRTYSVYTDPISAATYSEFFVCNGVLYPNADYEVGLTLTQSGSTTNWNLWINPCAPVEGVGRFSRTGSRGSNSNGAQADGGYIGAYSDATGLGAGHYVIRAPAMPLWGDQVWMRGHVGETPQARMERLCTQNGIPLTVLSAADVPIASIIDNMGPQYYDTLTALLRECEVTGQGVLYDGLGPGLTYVTKRRRETNASGPATLVIDASSAQLMEPFAPIDDDQLTINQCEVNRRNATVADYTDRIGPMGVDSIGVYSTSYTVNPESDDGLVHYAEWMVGVGTQEGYRYPTVSFALETNSSLIPGWLACLPQSRIDVTNVAAIRRQHPDETIKLLLEGWHEEIDAFSWRVTANTTSAVPWNVVVLAAATGSTGDGIGRLQTESSQLNANYTSGTTISVRTNTGLRWITTSEDADSFPFDISVGGVKATVTGITGTSSPPAPQTFTLSAALPRTMTGSTTPGPPATPVEVWRPPVYGL